MFVFPREIENPIVGRLIKDAVSKTPFFRRWRNFRERNAIERLTVGDVTIRISFGGGRGRESTANAGNDIHVI